MAEELVLEIIHELKVPFNYSYQGESQKASFITLKPPSSKNLKECAYLKQCFFRSLPNTDEEVKDGETVGEDGIDAESILIMMSMSEKVNLDTVLLTAVKLFTSNNVGLIDGETQLKQSHVDLLGYGELEEMTGKYLENFILASSLKKMSLRSSKKS